MKIDMTYDKKFLVISSNYDFELNVMRKELTRELADGWILKKTKPHINTDRCFMNDYGMVPSGLWLYVMQVAKKYNFFLEMSDTFSSYINAFQLDYNVFETYINNMFDGAVNDEGKPFKPYDYQVKAAYQLLRYKQCCGEISTSGGKTLISYMIFKYLIGVCNIKKILYIVPSVDLAKQSAAKYEEYESFLKHPNHNWSTGILMSRLNKKQKEAVENCNILFGTFQSLCKRDSDFYKDFNACIEDECLHPDTLIKMGDGTEKPIKELIPGDLVYTYNEKTEQTEILPVKKVHKNLSKHQQMYELTMEDDTIIRITGNHKVYTSNRGYVRVDELTYEDDIIQFNL